MILVNQKALGIGLVTLVLCLSLFCYKQPNYLKNKKNKINILKTVILSVAISSTMVISTILLLTENTVPFSFNKKYIAY